MIAPELINRNRFSKLPVLHQNCLTCSVASLRNEMNNLFDEFHDSELITSEENFPAVDIIENGKLFKVRAELPGIDPKNVDISVTNGILNIVGEKADEKEGKGNNYLRREASYGSFQRAVQLPPTADVDKSKAAFNNGILTIEVPKNPESLQNPKKVQISKNA